MKDKICLDCEHFKYCEKEEWVCEYTLQRSVFGCLIGYDEEFDEVDCK